jgi:hypothetical protein
VVLVRTRFKRRGALLAGLTLVAGSVVTVGSATTAGANGLPPRPAPSAANPTIDGPVSGGNGAPSLLLARYPLSQVGYTESEYFVSGTASSYANVGPLGADGKWSVAPATTAAYKTRMVVVRPSDPSTFSGTVMVEWFNVSGGSDGAPDWSFAHDEMIRKGDVYIGVSAQTVGVAALKAIDPVRYGSLVHPGDSYSYDMFSQAAQAVHAQAATILGGLQPKRVIAAGESQSAFRLVTYVNAIDPLVNEFDSFLINSRSAGSAVLSQAPQAAIPTPAVVLTRTDSPPVLTFQTETDVAGPLFYLPARQPDSKTFRLWEVAGASHADAYLVTQFPDDDTSWASDLDQFAAMTSPPSSVSIGTFTLSCPVGFNTGEQHYVFQTAWRDLVSWTRTGTPPRSMPRLDVDTTTTPPSYRKDANGNVLGGIRNPAVDAPIATLSGVPPTGAPGFCVLFGQTHPFTPSQMSALYPTHKDFVKQWRAAVRSSAKAGYLLPEDAHRLEDVVSPDN